MAQVQVQEVLKRFNEFADSYIQKGVTLADQNAYILKREHTIRVLEAAKGILERSADVSEEEKLIVQISAILHDVGRFEQWKTTGSYKDESTGGHAKIGADMLQFGLIQKFIPETRDYDKIIISAVRWHGSLELPDDLSDEEKLVTQILRDADRMDIFYQCTLESDYQELYKQDWGGQVLTRKVREKFKKAEPIDFKLVQSKIDMLALRMGLMKQLSMSASRKYVLDKKLPKRMADFFERKFPYYERREVEWLKNNTVLSLHSQILIEDFDWKLMAYSLTDKV